MPLSKVIARSRPDHPSLDFDVLRAEGIQHLEHFATEMWSDYNAHDPGITILEVLAYAITDLGYRTRMIPVQDLMATADNTQSFGFTADAVLTCSPVTALDYRKLMIDVKGVKNAWLLKSGNEVPIYKMGLVFPTLQNDAGEWDYEKVAAFAKKYDLPIETWINAVTLIAGEKPASNTPEDIYKAKTQKYFACVDRYLKTYERDPNLQKYKDIIDLFGNKDELEQSEVVRYFSKPGVNLSLNDKYVGFMHSAVKSLDPIDIEVLTYPVEIAGFIKSYLTNYGKIEKLRDEGYLRGIKDAGFTVKEHTEVKTAFITFLTSKKYTFLVPDDDGQRIPATDADIDKFLSDQHYDFAKFDADKFITENIVNEANEVLSTTARNEFKTKFFKVYSNIITAAERDKLRTYIDQNGDNAPISNSADALWVELRKAEFFNWKTEGDISWTNVEAYEFKKGINDQVDYAIIQKFINEDLPVIDRIRPHYGAFIANYNPADKIKNITFYAYQNTISPIYNISDDVVIQLVSFTTPTSNQLCSGLSNALIDHLCEYGMWGITFDKDKALITDSAPLDLSGLYTILLDLDENLDPDIPNDVNPVLNRVKATLHANRALCEDFVDFKIVEDRPIGICLHLDLDPTADEIEIIAEAIRRMQLYLSPAPRFRTFAQRLAELQAAGLNYSAEHIFNGPLLENGFLVDSELGDNQLRTTYYHSDLLTEIKYAGNGILGTPVLKIKAAPETLSDFMESTSYGVKGGEYAELDVYYKAVIDLDRSKFRVTKGARTFDVSLTKIGERLELLRLINDTDPLEPRGGPQWEVGTYRPDLGDYRSVQYEFPANYAIGDNILPEHIVTKRKAQSKQLQAYLAYFDQILASYLQQLGRVRTLLSVDQPSNIQTRLLSLLYDMPGIRDLVGLHAKIPANISDWNKVLQGIRDDLTSIAPGQGNPDSKMDRQLVTEVTVDLRSKTEWNGIFELRSAIATALNSIHPRLHELYHQQIEDYFWEKYIADPNNDYAKMIHEMAESPADNQRRRNQLFDHLLARFGETFSDYAATLLRPESEPEDNPLLQDFESYLGSKANFLRETARLSYERNKGYNYKKFSNLNNFSDVWNTENVSGVQRRVSRLLGIDNWNTRSLIAEPNFRIDRFKSESKRGMANYFGSLRRRIAGVDTADNSDEAVPLMRTPNYKSPREAQEEINELYNVIWQAKYYAEETDVPANTPYWFTVVQEKDDYKAVLLKPKRVVKTGEYPYIQWLQSEVLSLDEARLRVEVVMDLVQPQQQTKSNEGFHIVEHILLRPLETDDALLQLSLGCQPEEMPRDPYSFWITVVAPKETTRFSDLDFRKTFEHSLRSELPAHIAARFCYLSLDEMYKFEEQFGRWMFEKAKCNPPNYCRVDEETKKLVELLNAIPAECPCDEQEPEITC